MKPNHKLKNLFQNHYYRIAFILFSLILSTMILLFLGISNLGQPLPYAAYIFTGWCYAFFLDKSSKNPLRFTGFKCSLFGALAMLVMWLSYGFLLPVYNILIQLLPICLGFAFGWVYRFFVYRFVKFENIKKTSLNSAVSSEGLNFKNNFKSKLNQLYKELLKVILKLVEYYQALSFYQYLVFLSVVVVSCLTINFLIISVYFGGFKNLPDLVYWSMSVVVSGVLSTVTTEPLYKKNLFKNIIPSFVTFITAIILQGFMFFCDLHHFRFTEVASNLDDFIFGVWGNIVFGLVLVGPVVIPALITVLTLWKKYASSPRTFGEDKKSIKKTMKYVLSFVNFTNLKRILRYSFVLICLFLVSVYLYGEYREGKIKKIKYGMSKSKVEFILGEVGSQERLYCEECTSENQCYEYSGVATVFNGCFEDNLNICYTENKVSIIQRYGL